MPKISNIQNKIEERRNFELNISSFLKYLEQQQFSKSVIERHHMYLSRFQDFCIQNNISDFLSNHAISTYLKSINASQLYTIQFSRKTLQRFKDFLLTGSFKIIYLKDKIFPTSTEFNKCLESFSDFLSQSEIKNSTKESQFNRIRLLLIHLEKSNISSFKDLSRQDICNYINSSNVASSTKVLYANTLKKFFNFAFEQNWTSFSGNELFPKIRRNPHERILSFYSIQEVSNLISVIDTSTKIGKRDYSIVLLASVLGFRASDIINLTFDNIDWDKKLIKIFQQKTGKELIQPFPDEIFFAILDYLKNARPKTNSQNIFVSFTTPCFALSRSALSKITTEYFKLANIDISYRKHGIHSLRHSFANNLLHNNISLQNISASLGHSLISTSVMYTNIDINNLKLLSLEVN